MLTSDWFDSDFQVKLENDVNILRLTPFYFLWMDRGYTVLNITPIDEVFLEYRLRMDEPLGSANSRLFGRVRVELAVAKGTEAQRHKGGRSALRRASGERDLAKSAEGRKGGAPYPCPSV